MTSLEIRGLNKRYGEVTALHDFSVHVASGEFAVVLGESGSGKTTLLRLIAGLERVDGGEILLGGTPMNEVDPRDRDVAMVFQQDGLLPHLTVAENLEFPLRMQRMASRDRKNRASETAELLGIADLMKRRPDELSGGQRQRAALGRALVRRPRLFLLDEPLGQLDTPLRISLRDELRTLQQKFQITTLLVTHDQSEAMALADRLIILDQHRCVQQGAPLEVYDRPATPEVGQFLGTPPMNLLDCVCDDGHITIAGIRLSMPQQLAGQRPRRAGIRPERLTLGPHNPQQENFKESPRTCRDLVWNAEVKAVRQLGFDSVIVLQIVGAQTLLKVRLAGRASAQQGDLVAVSANGDDICWFQERH